MYPFLEKYIFAEPGKQILAPSTAFWINGSDISKADASLKEIQLNDKDIVEIEPALVGG